MNVDKLKRVNMLANTLKQQGLAASSQDAVSLANDFSCGQRDEDLDHIFIQQKTEETVEKVDVPAETPETKEKADFGEEQIKSILQSFCDQVSGEVNRISEKLENHEQVLSKLSEQLKASESYVQERQAQEQHSIKAPEQKEAEEQPKQQAPVQEQPSPAQEKQQDKPRSGGYKSDDVSIEKFFYYGQK